MQTLSIKEVLTFTPGSLIPATEGTITAVSPYQNGDTSGVLWTLQNIRLVDDGGEVTVKLCNQTEISQAAIGQGLVIVSTKKASGQLVGVKVAVEQYVEEGVPKSDKILEVTRAARVMSPDDYVKECSAAPVQKPAPAPAAQPQQPAAVKQPEPPRAAPAVHAPSGVVDHASLPPAYVSEIRYERVVNTGNFCSEKLGVTLSIQPGLKAEAGYKSAKAFVDSHLPPEFIDPKSRKIS